MYQVKLKFCDWPIKSTYFSVIAHEMKVEEALVERSRKTQNRSEYAKHSASKKALGEELLRVKKFMQASQQNKNQYILAIKGMIHSISNMKL